MQFQVVQDFRLAAFEEAGLAMTRNSGTNSAWRFGVQMTGLLFGGEVARTTSTDTTSTTEVRPVDSDQYSVRVDLLRVRRFHPARRVGLELGFGPTVEFDRSWNRVEGDGVNYSDVTDYRNSASRYGLAGRLGVEVFLARDLSLHAHYAASAGYKQETFTLHSTVSYVGGAPGEARYEEQRREWFLSDDGVSMGISVYL